MKLLNIMMKNYKVLFRSKASAAVVVLGPLLIILLVGLAFNNSQSLQVNVGTYSPDESGLTSVFKQNMVDEGYNLINYTSEDECIRKIQEGITHICVTFPPDFSIENNKINNVSLYVDNSRQNLVYQITETIKSSVQGASSDVSLELTTDLLQAIQNTKNVTASNINKVIVLKSSADAVNSDANNIGANANTIDLDTGTISLSGITSSLEDLKDALEDIGSQALTAEEIEETYELPGTNFSNDMNSLVEDLEDLENSSLEDVDDVINVVGTASSNIDTLQEKITAANNAKTAIKTKSNAIKTKAAAIKVDLDSVKSQLEFIQSQINALTVTDAENIVNPVELNVKNVSAEHTKLIFLFPFLLILIIMFVGILLSSTLIVLEKSGKAYFRNFTTSTKDETFIFSTFLTAFCLVLAQVVTLLAVAFIVMKSTMIGSIGVSLTVIFLSTALFVMLGMAIGYSFNTQQATNMVSISFGSVFLLLSNLILPIETISPVLRTLTNFNPYVIASEILRKSMLFEATFFDVQIELAMLLLYSILILIIILMTHKLSKIKYLGIVTHHKKVQTVTLGENDYFEIGDKFEIKNKEELYVALVEISDTDFKTFVDANRKEFLLWIKDSLKDPTLARKFKSLKREEMLTVLDKIVDKNKLPRSKEFLAKNKEAKKREEEAKAFEEEPRMEEKKKRKLFSRKKTELKDSESSQTKKKGKKEDKSEEKETENKEEDKKDESSKEDKKK